MNKPSTTQLLTLAKWIVFIIAIVLDWTGHLDTHEENITETMIAALAGVNISAFLAGRVGNLSDLLKRLAALEASVASGDGQTPPVPQAVATVVQTAAPALAAVAPKQGG